MTTLAPLDRCTPLRPSALRRTAVVASGVLACALPTLWTAGTVAELATGAERDHLFHQVTGQGLLLGAIWLGGLLPLLVAGWRRRPGPVSAALHLCVAVGAVVAAALAPGNGGLFVAAVVLVTGALVWAALPQRPRLVPGGIDPVLAPIALAAAAMFVPFVLTEAGLQRGCTTSTRSSATTSTWCGSASRWSSRRSRPRPSATHAGWRCGRCSGWPWSVPRGSRSRRRRPGRCSRAVSAPSVRSPRDSPAGRDDPSMSRPALFSRTVTSAPAPSARPWAAGGPAAFAALACLAAVVLLTRAGAWGGPSTADAPVDLAVGLAYPLMGALVLIEGRGSRTVGALLLVAGVAGALAALSTAVAVTAQDVTWGARAAAQLSSAVWVPGFLPLITLLPLAYPDGLLPGRAGVPCGPRRSPASCS